MPTDYSKGKIYKIISPSTGLTYYGSTVEKLARRMSKHRYQFKNNTNNTTAHKVLACGDAKIYLVEKYPCADREELDAREGWYQQNFACVNQLIAGRNRSQYRQENKETIAKQCRRYYEDNKEAILKKNRQYWQYNKEALTSKQRDKFMCECGAAVSRTHMARHLRDSKQHQQYMMNPFGHL